MTSSYKVTFLLMTISSPLHSPKTIDVRVGGEGQSVIWSLHHSEVPHDFRRKVTKPARWDAQPVASPKIKKINK